VDAGAVPAGQQGRTADVVWVAVRSGYRCQLCSEQGRQIVGDGGHSGIDDHKAFSVAGDDVAVETPPRHPSDRKVGNLLYDEHTSNPTDGSAASG
jgi:hypothetical protein